ncbi:hypothetical protein E2562_031941 [Oryza meyeriana var. granulata]|uniref:Uncharacterized protein n=1 Tax=Oryza meyeriana var. granulata TaxID=110450 RepID=A0A6G1F071_9ORYZ|nr:hypothetical protein E2562_031941 [Oryza meyeriana var. granulata]
MKQLQQNSLVAQSRKIQASGLNIEGEADSWDFGVDVAAVPSNVGPADNEMNWPLGITEVALTDARYLSIAVGRYINS